MEAVDTIESGLGNHDLNPTTTDQRTWTWVDFTALWVGMAHNVVTWTLAGSLIQLGLTWWQAILIIAAGNLIVLGPIILNSHPGAKYGIPFPIIARASFGIRGANLATLVRGIVGAGWFGIQVFVGTQALSLLLTTLIPGLKSLNDIQFLYQGCLNWVLFLAFLAANLVVLRHGMAQLRRFERWAAPSVLILAVILFVWAWRTAGGLGPIITAPPTKHIDDLPGTLRRSLMGAIAFWSTLSLNASDFTRFSRSQKDQITGQVLGMPTTMIVFSILGVLTTSATSVIFGHAIWDAVDLIKRLPSTPLIVLCLLTVVVATMSVNVPANLVSAAYDISNLAPRKISLWRGALITAAVGTIMMPWQLMATASDLVFKWLGNIGVFLGPVAGILIADYWWIRRRELSVPDLYKPDGIYRYWNGVNPRAILAIALGVAAAYSADIAGYFKLEIPMFQILTDLNWVTGFVAAFLVYGGTSLRGRSQAL